MSDTSENTGADGIPEKETDPARMPGGPVRDEVRDEVRLDLDEEKLDEWAEVRDSYAVDPGSEMARPALTESEDADDADASPHDEDDEDEEDEDDDLAEGHQSGGV